VKSRPDIRFIPFAVTEFGALGGHVTAFLTEPARHATASKGMHVGKLLTSLCRKASLAVHVDLTDNVLRGLSAVADGVEAAFPRLVCLLLHATAVFNGAIGRKHPRASSGGA
jgi:hypothetical protein